MGYVMTSESSSPVLAELRRIGQSIWYDNLSREVLRDGTLQSLVARGVTGLTSNPTIFKNAIVESSDYDSSIRELARKGLDTDAVCEALFVLDVGAAADLLRPVFDRTQGADGYASVEVSPLLADDVEGTVAAGRRIFAALGRPNVMIKVPATTAGISAIETLLRDGINVNVTLIFSVVMYEAVMEAYFKALEARVAKGEPIDTLSSVASFFVSRVDSIVERECQQLGKDIGEWKGKVGIANCAVAYARFLERSRSDRFAALREKGARLQRPLWASTGTKNPDFSPVMYVEALAAPDTVNTVPPATLDAVLKGITPCPAVGGDASSALQFLDRLRQGGILFERLLEALQEDGVRQFRDAYEALVASIDSKRKVLDGR
jgi:transaldolase